MALLVLLTCGPVGCGDPDDDDDDWWRRWWLRRSTGGSRPKPARPQVVKTPHSGYLLKDAPRGRLIQAVRGVFDGEMVLAPTVARRLVAEFTDRRRVPCSDSRVDRLSPREREVLVLAGRGLTNTEIASQLWLSEATVKTHLARALTKLELRDRVAAVVFCHQTGMV